EVIIPNIFSPNQDGINDEFAVRYTGKEAYSLVVQDRWGRTVFEAEGPSSTWDGQVGNNSAPEGVYYYMLKVGSEEYSGNVTLLR
ncbi:MAG: gliding motility-associated C-terminal domain-containing protein, partial [Bacteroidota bacterium]